MKKTTLVGRDYRAVVAIQHEHGVVRPGGTCEAVPESSLPWLLAQGAIAPSGDQTAQSAVETAKES